MRPYRRDRFTSSRGWQETELANEGILTVEVASESFRSGPPLAEGQLQTVRFTDVLLIEPIASAPGEGFGYLGRNPFQKVVRLQCEHGKADSFD